VVAINYSVSLDLTDIVLKVRGLSRAVTNHDEGLQRLRENLPVTRHNTPLKNKTMHRRGRAAL
jgi:hypothetical protein